MRRATVLALGVVLVVSLAMLSFGAAGALADDQQDDAANSTNESEANESIKPGEQLNGVVGVQEAEVDREVTERTYGVKLANAASDEAKADLVGEKLGDAEERIEELEEYLEELEEKRETGEISDGQYQAEVAKAEAEKATAEQIAEGAAVTAEEIPEEILADRGINVDAIEDLRDRAADLGGPETAEIAKTIAGDDVGQSLVDNREPGAPIETDNVTDDAGPPTDQDDVDAGAPTDEDDVDAGAPDDVDETDDETDSVEGDEPDESDTVADDADQEDEGTEEADDGDASEETDEAANDASNAPAAL